MNNKENIYYDYINFDHNIVNMVEMSCFVIYFLVYTNVFNKKKKKSQVLKTKKK